MLTGGPSGQIGRLLGDGQGDAAAAALQHLMHLFPGRLYVELMRHGTEIEERIEPALIELAYKLNLPLVATNDVYFSDEGMYAAHDALLCIAEGTYVGESNRRPGRQLRHKNAYFAANLCDVWNIHYLHLRIRKGFRLRLVNA